MKAWCGLLFACTLVCCAATAIPPSAPSPLLLGPMPKLGRRTVDGNSIDVAGLRGRVVMLEFFSKHCEPCIRGLSVANRIQREKSGVIVIGVGTDELQSDVEETVRRLGLQFPVVHDRSSVVAGRYRVSELPAVFVADRGGIVRWVGVGDVSETAIESAIDAVSGRD